MEHVSVRLPENLDEEIESSAEDIGISKSEKIRQDLTRIYFD